MDLLTSKSEDLSSTIALIASGVSSVGSRLAQAKLDYREFDDYSSLSECCRQQQPPLLLIDQDDENAALVNAILKNLGAKEFLGVPVLVMANISMTDCIMKLLKAGASDVVSKEAADIELLGRIKALVHRSSDSGEECEFPPFIFGVNNRLLFKNGVLIETTSIEFKLALYLFSHPNVVHSRDKLLEEVWGITASIDSRRVDTQISRLRARLGLNGRDNPWRLISVYVRGYMLTMRK